MRPPLIHSLIIGGTRGMGKALVESWGADPARRVSVIGRKRPADQAPSASRVRHYPVDLQKSGPLHRALKRIVHEQGRVHQLVFFQRYRGEGDDWQGEIQTTLEATREIIESLSKAFAPGPNASIVIVGSSADHLIAEDCSVGYHVAKAGLQQMVRYYAVALAPQGIRVNCVTPGTVLKEASKDFYRRHRTLAAAYRTLTPLGRMGSSEDIVQAIEFLSSARASFITGQNLIVDGGLTLRWQGSLARFLH